MIPKMTKQIRQGSSRFLDWTKSVKEWISIIVVIGGAAIWLGHKVDHGVDIITGKIAVVNAAQVYMPKDSADHVKIDSLLDLNETRWTAQYMINHRVDTALISLRTDADACLVGVGLR